MKFLRSFFLFFFGLFCANGFGAVPIIITDSTSAWEIRGETMDHLEDAADTLTIFDVSDPSLKNRFQPGYRNQIVTNKHLESAYWIKVTVIDKSLQRRNHIIELLDFRIDYLEVYLPDGSGSYSKNLGGASFHFRDKQYQYKNFLFDYFNPSRQPENIYIKIKAKRPVSLIGAIKTYEALTRYSTTEYFLLALFYGIISAMVLYNFFLFMALKDWAYLFYVLYVLSIGIYALSQDGLGFEYLWYNHPEWNDYIFPVSNYSMIVWALFYARSFLNTKTKSPRLDKGIMILLVFRTLIFIAWTFYPPIAYNAWIDIIPFFYLYIAGIISWMSGYMMARFYVLAFTLFFAGFVFSVLNSFQLITASIFTVYSFNIGVLCEMILLSLALADRIKMLTFEKEKAQRETIIQFQEKEQYKDKLNKELEEKVMQRTQELEAKNRELDHFIYRSSHDIKGPLKSVIGIALVGVKDAKDDTSKNFFQHILKSSKKLDHVVDHLVSVINLKEMPLEINKIDFEQIFKITIEKLKYLQEYKNVQTFVQIKGEEAFFSDERLLQSILFTILENALKYVDRKKSSSFVKMEVTIKDSSATLVCSDNGMGLDKATQEKVFDMFYKANSDSLGTDFGLYMAKISVEKLGGTIKVESESGNGTSFIIHLDSLTKTSSEMLAPDKKFLTSYNGMND